MSIYYSLKQLGLKITRKLSAMTRVDIFSTIYRGQLRGYKFLANTSDDYFTTEYEHDCFTYVTNEIKKKPGSVIYDLGANLGYFSLLCSSYGNDLKIFAFEPIPENMRILCRHLLINNINNVVPVNLAISDHMGMIDFSADNQSVSYTYKQASSYYGNRQLKIKVGIVSLDSLGSHFGFPDPDIIKIDVEGAEFDVLSGGADLINRCRPRILLSTHEAHVNGVEKKCLSFLESINYSCEKMKNDPQRMTGLNDFWCVPK